MRNSVRFAAFLAACATSSALLAAPADYHSQQLPALVALPGETIQVAGMQVMDNNHASVLRQDTSSGSRYAEVHSLASFGNPVVSIPRIYPSDPFNNNVASVLGEYVYLQRHDGTTHRGYSRCRYTAGDCSVTDNAQWQALAAPGAGLVLLAQHASNLNLSGDAIYSVVNFADQTLKLRRIDAGGSVHEFADLTFTPGATPAYVTAAGYVDGYLVAVGAGATGPVAWVFSSPNAATAFPLGGGATQVPVDMNAGGRVVLGGTADAATHLVDVEHCDLSVVVNAGQPQGVTCNRQPVGSLPVVGGLMNATRITDGNDFIYYRNHQLGGGTFVVDTDAPAAPVPLTALIVDGPVPPAGDQVATIAANGDILVGVDIGNGGSYFRLTPGQVSGPLAVAVDVKPGSCANPVVIRSKGVLPVAIGGTAEIAATDINPGSVRFAGALAPVRAQVADVMTPGDCAAGGDGVDDLLLQFDSRVIGELGATVPDGAILTVPVTGELYDGRAIEGADTIRVKNK